MSNCRGWRNEEVWVMCVCDDRLRCMYMYCLSETDVSLQMDENGRESFHVSMVLNIPRFRVDYRCLPTYLPIYPTELNASSSPSL